MLEEILLYLKNWFVKERYTGTVTIQNSIIELPFLQDGQFYRIQGSIFNDGLHQEGDHLHDETFYGVVSALAIPPVVLDLAKDIEDWNKKYESANSGIYQSETFSDYSYTRAKTAQGTDVTWKDVFRLRLAPWRKL